MSLIVDGLLLSAWFVGKPSKPVPPTPKGDDTAQWNVENYHPILKELEK